VTSPDGSSWVTAAQRIIDQGRWCVVQACVDVPGQRWEARLLVCDDEAEVVAGALADEVAREPGRDARLAGCDRVTLRLDPSVGTHLCHVAQTLSPPASVRPAHDRARTRPGSIAMLVRDGMNPIVVTVGPAHTLREAARRMTARGVGAAVVTDHEQPGPGIITERDILHSNGVGQDIDTELVADHRTSKLVYAAAGWSLEQAADAMVRGGFRHVLALDGSEIVGILSMRDIVRCWTSAGATCELSA
jgi:CBS domain-containing protein